jgi:hypothetical protein
MMLGSTPATRAEPSPQPSGRHHEDLAIPCRTCPQSSWTPASARMRPPDTRLGTVSADQSLLRTPRSGWPGDGHGRPHSDGQAADTSSAPSVRPCARPASHGLHVLALTGHDGNGHARLWPTQPRPAPGPAHHDHPHPTLDAGTSTSLIPVRCPRGSVRRPPWTPRSDSLPDTPSSVASGRTPSPPTRHSMPTESDADRDRTNRTAGPRTPPIARPQRRPAGHAQPLLWRRRCGWQPRSARR